LFDPGRVAGIAELEVPMDEVAVMEAVAWGLVVAGVGMIAVALIAHAQRRKNGN
jgi:hypothetical protein